MKEYKISKKDRLLRQPGLILSTLALLLILLLAGCGTPPRVRPADPDIERNAAAARSAYASGALPSAGRFYEKALDRARLADQAEEISRLAYNLAMCRAQTGKYDEALALLDEAQYEAGKARDAFPEASLLRAEIFRCLGKTNEALALAEAEINSLNKRASHRLQFQLFLAELACDRNDGGGALSVLDKLEQDLLKASTPAVRAREAGARGRALILAGRPGEAAACFDRAAGFYQAARRYPEMGQALYQAGDAYAAAQQAQAAFDRCFRAARTFLLCGENEKAQAALENAAKSATEERQRAVLKILAQLKAQQDAD